MKERGGKWERGGARFVSWDPVARGSGSGAIWSRRVRRLPESALLSYPLSLHSESVCAAGAVRVPVGEAG